MAYRSYKYMYKRLHLTVKDFLHCLLEFKPSKRISLATALKHLWTTAHKPMYDLQYPDTLMGTQSLVRTASVHIMDSAKLPVAPTRMTTEDPYACNGPLVPAPLLKRCIKVLQCMEEHGGALPDPSVEMHMYTASQDELCFVSFPQELSGGWEFFEGGALAIQQTFMFGPVNTDANRDRSPTKYE
ncbi:hypothetical protein B0H10DRAFT_1945993 [Mycena sp. CBHHK59/15]|nr:hypothetical protein B0H10DRAFT_1945993 [Mycena sp. CBHHK59/15]